MEMSDIIGLSLPIVRVIDCLDRGMSSMLSPYVYKRLERAKMEIEKERANQNALIVLKEAMTQDFIHVARTSRDHAEVRNVAEIYGNAILELQNIDSTKLPSNTPSNEWAAHFYDCSKDCSDDEIRTIWSKILAGEICEPGKFYKRTLTNLKQMEKHEAEWFSKLCKYTIADAVVPEFVLSDNIFPFNEYLSLVDCGFVNANKGIMRISHDRILSLKSASFNVKLQTSPYELHVLTLTDTGIQICRLVETSTDDDFLKKLLDNINESKHANAEIVV